MEDQLLTQLEDDQDEVEGLDTEDNSWGDYPLDEILIRNDHRTVHDVLRRIQKGQYVMNPDFQRDFIWSDEKQSKLIESVIMRIPLPVFYTAEDREGRMIVVDGLQRLSTFQRFLNNQSTLKLPDREELHGKRFKDLLPKFQNRIEDCNLVFYILDSKAPERARLDIFERVNGGVALKRQQMRNCLFMGPATKFLKREANCDEFLEATGRSLNRKIMRDREFVNRFCAFQLLGIGKYTGDMDLFLAETLEHMNRMPEEDIMKLKSEHRRALSNNYFLFGKHAFRKRSRPDDQRSMINASIWDVMSTGLSRYAESCIESKKDDLRLAYTDLLHDREFDDAITLATNGIRKVRSRFELSTRVLEEILGAYSD